MISVKHIQKRLYEIRGQRVMFDFDLAQLYEVETRALNQAVKRNSDLFPEDFMFQLHQTEWKAMSSQFVMTLPIKTSFSIRDSVLLKDKAPKMDSH